VGLVLKTTRADDGEDWKDKLTNSFSVGDSILGFCIATLAVFGVIGWVTYGSYGMASLPIRLMKSSKDKTDKASKNLNQDKIEMEIKTKQASIQYLASKYDLSGKPWEERDKKQYDQLKREERRLLQMQSKPVEDKSSSIFDKCCSCWTAFTPIRIVVGILLMMVSLLIVLSLTLSSVDKLMHSTCKYSCAWALDSPTLPNPIDLMLTQFSKAFPIDFLVFGGLTIYMFLCALSGLVTLGVRIFFWKLYEIRPRNTSPTALLMGCWMLMFVALSLNMEVLTLAPRYASFGNQFYYSNSTGIPSNVSLTSDLEHNLLWLNDQLGSKEDCTIEESNTNGRCVMSQVSRFIHMIDLQLPFFGVVLFFANLAFLGFFLLWLVREAACPPDPDGDYQSLKEDEQFYGEDP